MLPAIKCSDCGVEIEIMSMADHVCSKVPSQKPQSPKSRMDRAATFSTSLAAKTSGLLRPGRMPPPPKIDSSVANKPFAPRDQLTPLSSYSDPRSASPISPGYKPKMMRSATSPMPRPFSPPSPDLLSGNMDCPFPPFPTSRSGTPTPKEAKPKSRDGLQPIPDHRYAEADPLYAPLSPRTTGGASVLKRMNTIAPGPFDARSGKGPEKTPPIDKSGLGHRRNATHGSIGSNYTGNVQRASSVGSTRSRSSTLSSNGVVGLPSRPKQSGPPARPSRPEGIDAFLEQLQEQANELPKRGLSADSRARTFPLRKDSEANVDVPPLPSLPPLQRRPTMGSEASDSSSIVSRGLPSDPKSSNGFPPRSASRSGSFSGSRAGLRRDDPPPVPALPVLPNIQTQVPAKPLHTPSDSGSSDDSVANSDIRSATSSRSSPPASEAWGLSRRPSKASAYEPPAQEDNRIQRIASPSVDSRTQSPRPLTPETRSDSRNGPTGYNRGMAPEPLMKPRPFPVADGPESPMDPAIQLGLFNQRRPSKPSILPTPQPPPPPSFNFSMSPPKGAPPMVAPQASTPPVSRRGTMASKGKCRGCSEPIVGKSVKAADGRLTGRYHKQCFVCKTCRAPFQTADFYVINNFPYCEQHYHQLNGSLCKGCNRGIEGQYLETDQRQKFHSNCFTCNHCRVRLRDDYFEVGGKVFCERHAFHVAQQNNMLGARRNPERRTTRLMMMM
ncbi:uncharacterized protein BDZ99DRAFT_488839 [Mytilinidion resinicola]|uniref:LIM zinc-binding domain-containing protein n=1 Tax=Mytilinidion resinicola TaxID=574789 RepID=A0A6A6YMH3_9PEZI|nr:uncharacterized protein BDZ99DRAFT_488839 [Mytilinidion resinicola]KAF2809067.1 hypothetical protein BDZ99DRAFT_488839 [Mytilinidion resinicola]